MISYITGIVLKTNIAKDSYIDIQTASGLGYRISVPSTYILPPRGEKYSLYTHFHVREDNQTLFGFEREEERDFFEILISVSGIGPKIGLAIISTYSKKELEEIITQGDAKKLSKVNGLGLKGAQKIILELRGKVDFEQMGDENKDILKELKEVLKTLGFSGEQLKGDVEYAGAILKTNSEIEIEDLVKKVLSKND